MENEPKKQYLPEDKDLLDAITGVQVSEYDNTSVGKISRLTAVQIKATLRNRKTAKDLDKTTKKYSFALIAFAVAQLVLGIFQFLFDAEFSGHEWVGLLYVVAAIILIVYVVVTATKDINKD